MELSLRTERLLSRVQLQAVDHSPRTTGTQPGALTSSECAGILAQLSQPKFKHVVMVLSGMADQTAYQSLARELVNHFRVFGWSHFIDLNDPVTLTKVETMVFIVIQQFAQGKGWQATTKANALGITGRAYYKTWNSRFSDLNLLLVQWAHDADYELNRLLK